MYLSTKMYIFKRFDNCSYFKFYFFTLVFLMMKLESTYSGREFISRYPAFTATAIDCIGFILEMAVWKFNIKESLIQSTETVSNSRSTANVCIGVKDARAWSNVSLSENSLLLQLVLLLCWLAFAPEREKVI